MTTNPLSDIAFEDINDYYCLGHYGEFKVIMMKKNGYINATKMCQDISEQTESKKEYRKWRENKSVDELLEEISSAGGIPPAELMIIISTGSRDLTIIRGTYVHPDMIPHIASWASPKFAVKVSLIVNKYINKKELEKKEKLLKKKDDKIDELKEMMQKQSDEMTAKIDELLHKNKKMSKKLTIIKEQNQEITQQNDELLDKVDTITEDRVVRTQTNENDHMFVVMKDPDESDRNRYYAIRTKKRTIKPTIKRYTELRPNATKLIEITYNPNSINLYDRIKETLNKKLRFKINNFGLKGDYSESQMIKDIEDINDEKYEV